MKKFEYANTLERYLSMRYEFSMYILDKELNGMLVLKDDTFDHESTLFGVLDVFRVEVDEIGGQFPNISSLISGGVTLEAWKNGGIYTVRMAKKITEGPYCENARKVTFDGLEFTHDSLIYALQELDTMIIKRNERIKEEQAVLKKQIKIINNQI